MLYEISYGNSYHTAHSHLNHPKILKSGTVEKVVVTVS